MVAYVSRLSSKTALHFGRITLGNLTSYAPNLMFWGSASTFGLFVFTDGWPTFRDAFYSKIPYFGDHWVTVVAPEDSPQ
ncbi:unnamed protein product [Kluyveromyces dobzhanskii CBS 2104]|uniref:WGS project CCBQ000000000 data, contig 00012 n=1 Tax=Kluyveromyces dobzhanskii CBS 2104 TaxID=1427455 RepID=A0A0A8L371_9SACH|nr:unnamed protein product [Kluyveromyces dobzhanskii CBS 2104]